jgi:hypothetical protein
MFGRIKSFLGLRGSAATPSLGERTGKQQRVVSTFGGPGGASPLPDSYETYERMRKHPTIALARALSIAPILAAEWSVEADDDVGNEAVQFVQDQFLPRRDDLLETSLLGGCDFGFSPFEKVFAEQDGRVVVRKLKPLLQKQTKILLDEDTGAFCGFQQGDVVVPLENSLLINYRVEGTHHYGEPLLENVRETWNKWRKADAGAERYDEKVAGAHWFLVYPEGESTNEHGQEVDNATIAQQALRALESSGSIAMPVNVKAWSDAVRSGIPSNDAMAWKLELLADNGARQPTFINRLDYLDKLLVRGLLLPERAVLEGIYGTKAEAETHVDLALTNADLLHRRTTRLVNWHAVDQVLAINFGDRMRGKVRLVPGPIVDARLAFLKQLYLAVLTNPQGFLEEFGMLDLDALKDSLGVPKAKEVAQPGDESENVLPVEGVDPHDKRAATVRQLYASLRGA